MSMMYTWIKEKGSLNGPFCPPEGRRGGGGLKWSKSCQCGYWMTRTETRYVSTDYHQLDGRHRQRTEGAAAPEAYARITDKQFSTHLEQRGQECERTIKRGSKRVRKQFRLCETVEVQDHKTRRWSEDTTVQW